MGISIKNDAVEAKVRQLAAASGLGVTEAVEQAVDEALERRQKLSDEERLRRLSLIEQIVAEVKTLPIFDPRPIDDLTAILENHLRRNAPWHDVLTSPDRLGKRS